MNGFDILWNQNERTTCDMLLVFVLKIIANFKYYTPYLLFALKTLQLPLAKSNKNMSSTWKREM